MNQPPSENPDRHDYVIILLTFGLYAGERLLLFAYFSRLPEYTTALLQTLRFLLFGDPPFQLFNVAFGFESWNPLIIGIQFVHAFLNFWILTTLFQAYDAIQRKRRGPV
jgi:hypothetical protein